MMDFIARSRALARSVRGTDDSGNDWLLDEGLTQLPPAAGAVPETSFDDVVLDSTEAHPCPNYKEDFEISSEDDDLHMVRARAAWAAAQGHEAPVSATTTRTQEEITPKRGGTQGVLSVTVACSFTKYLQDYVDKSGLNQLVYNMSDPDGLNAILDEISFAKITSEVKESFEKQFITSGVFMVHGSTFDVYHRGRCAYGNRELDHQAQKHVRTETAVLLRNLALAKLTKEAGLPWLIVVPHCSLNPLGLMVFDEVKEIAGDLEPIYIKHEQQTYQMLGTCVAGCTTIDGALERTMITGTAQQSGFVREGRWGNTLVRCVRDKVASLRKRLHRFRDEAKHTKNIEASMRLRGGQEKTEKQQENDLAIGGMKNPRLSLGKIPGHKRVGVAVAKVIGSLLDERPHIVENIYDALGAPKESGRGPSQKDVLECRYRLSEYLEADLNKDAGRTEIIAPLAEAWAEAANDPDKPLIRWLSEGAPAGILRHPECVGVFPLAKEPPSKEFELTPWDEKAMNYTSMEESPYGEEVLGKLVKSAYVTEYPSIKHAMKAHGGKQIIISKLALITTEKDGQLKHRLILDCRVSGTNSATTKWERIVLPTVGDVIADVMHLKQRSGKDQPVWFYVCDFTDAFYKVPLDPEEQRFFAFQYKGKVFVYNRVAQGSLDGPSLYGRLSAFVGRCTQSLLDSDEARTQIYTDDPIISILATEQRAKYLMAVVTMAWLALGFDMAFHKAQFGHKVTWIGYQLTDTASTLYAQIKESFLKDLLADSLKTLKKNIIGLKELRSYTGRCNHVSCLLWLWRPFLDSLWAAVASRSQPQVSDDPSLKGQKRRKKVRKTKAPRGTVWTKQVAMSISWIIAFLREQYGPVYRQYSRASYFGESDPIEVYLDASPFGLGGVLCINGIPVTFFTSKLDHHDERIHKQTIGDSAGQQAWECLAVLVALRAWYSTWIYKRAKITIKGDNVSALAMASRMKLGPTASLIGKELSLLYYEAQFEPEVIHIPGITNLLADSLSRLHEPNADYKIPPELAKLSPTPVPVRDENFYWVLAT